MSTSSSIRAAAAANGVDPARLWQLAQHCPIETGDICDTGFNIDDLANLLSEEGEDVGRTAALALRLQSEFGFLPRDAESAGPGGSGAMYFHIRYGD